MAFGPKAGELSRYLAHDQETSSRQQLATEGIEKTWAQLAQFFA
jgi:hypothetical protein